MIDLQSMRVLSQNDILLVYKGRDVKTKSLQGQKLSLLCNDLVAEQ